jgi:hypothetical protein
MAIKEYKPGTTFAGKIGLTSGANPALPVTPEYSSPFKFTGKIYGVTVDVSGDLMKDSEAELRLVMARQ